MGYRCTAVWVLCLLTAGVAPQTQAAIIVTPIGSPAYAPADIHLFSAPIGTFDDGFAEFGVTQQLLLPPPDHLPNPVLGIGPGAPHPGPYDTEFAKGVAANGFVDANSFTVPQYSNGNGVYLVFMYVPTSNAATGSSPDFTAGPILPNAIFPLTVDGSTFTNGTVNDVLGQFQVPALNAVPGFEGLDGFSHIPFFLVDNFDFAARPIVGDYEYRISITDAAGNGYDIDAIFDVPAPPSWSLIAGAFLMLGVSKSLRRSTNRY